MVKSRVGVQTSARDADREAVLQVVEPEASIDRGAPERPLVLGVDAHLRREMRGCAERHRVLFHTDRDERPSEGIDVRRGPIRPVRTEVVGD